MVPEQFYSLGKDGWRTPHALDFALQLSRANPETVCEIREFFGLQLVLRNRRFEVDWDGTKFGFGSFNIQGGLISFSLDAKVEQFSLQAMFRALENAHFDSPLAKFGGSEFVSVGSSTDGNLSLPFMMGLQKQIASVDRSTFNIFNSRKTITSYSVLRGRPKAKSIAIESLKLTNHFESEVLDNSRQKEMASLLVGTSRALYRSIHYWMSFLGKDTKKIQDSHKRLTRDIGHLAVEPLSADLVRRCSRPPYPFGLKRLAENCVRYWRYSKSLGPSLGASKGLVERMVVDMSRAFQIYAGAYLEELLTSYASVSQQDLDLIYNLEPPLGGPEFRANRSIEPDHLFFNETTKHLVVVEVKYSRALGIREHLSQLVTYLDFQNYQLGEEGRTGLLIYPGTSFSERKVSEFGHDLRILEIPIVDHQAEGARAKFSISIK